MLTSGDHLHIPAHARHRVAWTDPASRPSGLPCITEYGGLPCSHVVRRHRCESRGSGPAQAQSDYPNRVVKIVMPYVAGSVPDIFARALVPGLSNRLGQQFIVENRAGGSGAVGTAVGRARRPRRLHGADRAGGGAVGAAAGARRRGRLQVRLARPGLPDLRQHHGARGAAGFADQEVKDLVAAARQKPGALNYGHPGRADHPASRGRGAAANGRRSTSRTFRSAAGRNRSPNCLAAGSTW